MDFSKLSYGQIEAMASNLRSTASRMENTLYELKGKLNRVGSDDTWSGTAASQTKAEFDKLSAKFPEFSKAINDCADYLNKMVQNYQSVDKAVAGK